MYQYYRWPHEEKTCLNACSSAPLHVDFSVASQMSMPASLASSRGHLPASQVEGEEEQGNHMREKKWAK